VAHACNPSYQETEIRRIKIQSQPRQIVCKTPISKKPFTKKRAGGVAQGIGPEFKPQYCKNKKNKKKERKKTHLL
jgi:cell division septation protein DedD